MKTIEIKVYKFDELDKQTREKVIENYRFINVEDTFWYDWIKEDFIRLGLEIQEFDLGRRNYIKIYIDNFKHTSESILQEFGDSVGVKQTAKNYLDEYEKEYSEDILSYIRLNYDWETSDEAIYQTIEANDYDFTIEGKIY